MTDIVLSPSFEPTVEPTWPEGLSQQYLENHGLEACLVHIMGCRPTLLRDDTNNSRISWLDIIKNGVSNEQSDGSCHYFAEGSSVELDQHMAKKLGDARQFVIDMDLYEKRLEISLAWVAQEQERADKYEQHLIVYWRELTQRMDYLAETCGLDILPREERPVR